MEPSPRQASLMCVVLSVALATPVLAPAATSHHSPARGNVGTALTPEPASPLDPMGEPNPVDRFPVAFEKNVGQFADEVAFKAGVDGGVLFLTSTEAVWRLQQPGGPDEVIRMAWQADQDPTQPAGEELLPGRVHRFLGEDSEAWVTDVPRFESVVYPEVYPGIDLVFYGTGEGDVEFDLQLAPRADPSLIQLSFQGGTPSLQHDGSLLVRTPTGASLQQHAPISFQGSPGDPEPVSSNFRLLGNQAVGFEVGPYDPTSALVIDPVVELAYGTYYGAGQEGSQEDVHGVGTDGDGNIYVAGWTSAEDFPTTGTPSPEPPEQDRWNAFVYKLTPDGDEVLYSVLIGGSDTEAVQSDSLHVDDAGHVYLAGRTESPDFPTTTTTFGDIDGYSVFVSKLSPDGSELKLSTQIDGGPDEAPYARAVGVDPDANIYLSGNTDGNLPTAGDPVQSSFGGGSEDAFVAKLAAGGGSLDYLTYLGGSDFDRGLALDVTDEGEVIAALETGSDDIPGTPESSIQSGYGGGTRDVVVAKLDATGSSYAYFTYLGGVAKEKPGDLTLDADGNAYVVGQTGSSGFPLANAFQAENAGGSQEAGDAFVTQIDAEGSALVFSTFLGGSEDDRARGVDVDSFGHVLVGGYTASTDFPTQNTIQGDTGGSDGFVARFEPGGGTLSFSTYLGGADQDYAYGAVFQDEDYILFVGDTESTDFPVTDDAAYGTHQGGSDDGYLVRVALPLPSEPKQLTATQATGIGQVDLAWSAPNRTGTTPITSYKVYRGTTADDLELVSHVGNQSNYTDSGLGNGITYHYAVAAVNGEGTGDHSPTDSAQTRPVPDAPGDLLPEQGPAPGRIDLSWEEATVNDPGTGGAVTNYRIYRGHSPSNLSLLTEVGDQLAYTDTGLADNTTYHYAVSAVNDEGEGPRSSPEAGTTASLPTEPTELTAAHGDEPGEIELTWAPPTDDGGLDLTGYNVYRGPNPSNLSLAVELGNQTTYEDAGLADNTTYHYQVTALNDVGEGPRSSLDDATTPAPPGPPMNLTAETGQGDGEIDLCWNPPTDNGGLPVVSYTIYGAQGPDELVAQGTVTEPCWTHSGLPQATHWYYRVAAKNNVSEGPQGTQADAWAAEPPSEPRNLTVQTGSAPGEIEIAWESPLDDGGLPVDGYRVYRGPAADDLSFHQELANRTSWTDTGLPNGAFRCYALAAYNPAGEGNQSSTACAEAPDVPTPPMAPTADPGPEPRQITVCWQAPTDDGGLPTEGYTVYRADAPGGPFNESFALGLETCWTDTGLPHDTLFCYQVAAENAAGEGHASGSVCTESPGRPTAVRELEPSPAREPRAVHLAWREPVDENGLAITHYRVYRATIEGGPYRNIANVTPPATTYLDEDRLPTVRYYYKVSAVNPVGEGPNSTEEHARASTLVTDQPTPVGQAGDTDGDALPQVVEEKLCGPDRVREVFELLARLGVGDRAGACRGTVDYQPPDWHDQDHDLVPDEAEFLVCLANQDDASWEMVCKDTTGNGIPNDWGPPNSEPPEPGSTAG